MTTVRIGDAHTDLPRPRRIELDGPRYALLRNAVPGLVLPAPFDRIGDLAAYTDEQVAAARADLSVAGILVTTDDDREVVHPSVLASLLAHDRPDLTVSVDVRRFRETTVLRAALMGPLCSVLSWSLETVGGPATQPLQGVASDPVTLTSSSVDDLTLRLRDVLGPTPERPGREPVTIDAAWATALLASAREDLGDDPLPEPLTRFEGELPGTLILRIATPSHAPAELTLIFDGDGWWELGPTPEVEERAQLRLTPTDGDRFSSVLASALARRLGSQRRG